MKLKWRKVDPWSWRADCDVAYALAFNIGPQKKNGPSYRAMACVQLRYPSGRRETICDYRDGFDTVQEAKKAAEQLLREMVAGLAEQAAQIKEQLE